MYKKNSYFLKKFRRKIIINKFNILIILIKILYKKNYNINLIK